ncbi:hypothetical protein K1719_000050 [Acacia pycnantha]|nr:hypothetical protein K1719_000050 [Acacia pycnantha]
MARQVVALAFLLLAVVQAFAVATAASTPAPATSYNSDDDLAEPPTDGVIGVLEAADSPDNVVAAPMGGPVPPGAFDSTLGGSSDASTLRFSAVAAAATLAAGAIYF